jgi:superfamily II DNA or RNA helicase
MQCPVAANAQPEETCGKSIGKMENDDLWLRIEAILATASKPLTKREIAKRVRATPTEVNQRLYQRRNKWVQCCPNFDGNAPGWTLIRAPGRPLRDDGYAWQKDAIRKWLEAGMTGIVQAVTGTGKTYVGIRAVEQMRATERNAQVLIVVPTVVLMDQWHDRLITHFPGKFIGRHGGEYRDNFSKPGTVAVIAVIAGAWKKVFELLAHAHNGQFKSLLVADECHHYLSAPKHGRILDFPFTYRLGLSATVGHNPRPKPLGEILFDLDMKKAVLEYKLVPHFVMLNVAVEFTPREWEEYLDLRDRIKESIKKIEGYYGVKVQEFEDDALFRWIAQKLREDESDPRRRFLVQFQNYVFQRTALYSLAEQKLKLAGQLAHELVARGKKVLLFFERIESLDKVHQHAAEESARQLCASSEFWCRPFHSGLEPKERVTLLKEFRRSGPCALLACRSLDEGLDVPEIDAVVLGASSKSGRQRIQRIGRALRSKEGKKPLVITLYVRGTTDERVVRDDQEHFGAAAQIHHLDSLNYRDVMETLL